jgi:hypothetical protein
MPSPSSGADAYKLMERTRERCLVIKSRLNRDVDQRLAGVGHQLFGAVDAMLNQPLVRGNTERSFEGAGKVADGESAFAGNLRKANAAVHVLMEKLRGPSFLPWRQTSLRALCCFVEYTVPLKKMCSEDETELIESQNGGAVGPPKQWKDAFGDLGYN